MEVSHDGPAEALPLSHQLPGDDSSAVGSAPVPALVTSISQHGLRRPIIVWRGEIIDGVHRLMACLQLGIDPTYHHLPDDDDPREFLKAEGFSYRDMDGNARSMAADKLSRWSTRGRPTASGENSANLPIITRKEAADRFGVSVRSVSTAGRVLAEDGPAAAALRKAVDDWKIKCSDAARILDRPPEVQERAAELVIAGQFRTVKTAAERIEREIAQVAEAEARESTLALALGDTVTLHTATVAALQTLVPPGSVDAIITHPPENREFLPIYSDLATLAAHVLKPSGVLVVLATGMFLPQTLKNLENDQLGWMAELDLVSRGQPTGSGAPRFLRLHRRPVLVYSKGTFRMNEMDDLFEVPPPGELTDGLSAQETAMALLVERFAKPGQTVCDPVMLDRAGTALASRRRGCIFVGAERTQSCVDRIRKRLEDAEGDGKGHLDDRSPGEKGTDE